MAAAADPFPNLDELRNEFFISAEIGYLEGATVAYAKLQTLFNLHAPHRWNEYDARFDLTRSLDAVKSRA